MNKIVTDTYILNQPYVTKHVSSDMLQMSCYGYDFKNWVDEKGEVVQSDTEYIFTLLTKELSAKWEKHKFNVNFWKKKLAHDQEIYVISAVPYLDTCEYPENPTPPESKMRFSKWSIPGGVTYTLDNMSRVSCDMDLIAEFVKQWYVTFKYKNDDTDKSLCQITCDHGYELLNDEYPPISNFQKPCYTVSAFDPTSIPCVSSDYTVHVIDERNTLSAKYTDTNFTYDKNPHCVSVESYVKKPYYPGDVLVRYSDSGTPWTYSPIQKTSAGTYNISISLSAENYFERIYDVVMTIANPDEIDFYFEKYFDNSGNFVDSTSTKTVPYYPVDKIKYPKAYDTVSSDFIKWSPSAYLENPTSLSNRVSAVYQLKKFTVTYKYDNTINSLKGKNVFDEPSITVEYGQNAYKTSPDVVTVEGDGVYKCDGWFQQADGRDPSTRTSIGNNELEFLTKDISAYAFMRKYHSVKAYMVYGDNVVLSTLEGDVSTIIDYDYLPSDQIGLSDIPYYEFDHWYPTFDKSGSGKNGSWRIDKDNYSISAVYKAKTGTLKYHSHYPDI